MGDTVSLSVRQPGPPRSTINRARWVRRASRPVAFLVTTGLIHARSPLPHPNVAQSKVLSGAESTRLSLVKGGAQYLDKVILFFTNNITVIVKDKK